MILHTFAQAAQDYTVTTTELSDDEASLLAASFWLIMLVALLASAVLIASYWKIFTKAGEEGWKSIAPIYNYWTLAEIVGRPGWWALLSILMLVPFVNFIALIPLTIISILISIDLAKSFGKDTNFALLLIFLPFIGYPILAFGKATYQGPAGPVKNRPSATDTAGQFLSQPGVSPQGQTPLTPPDATSDFAFNQSAQSPTPQGPPQSPQKQQNFQQPTLPQAQQPQPTPQQDPQYVAPQAQVVQPQQPAVNQNAPQPVAGQAPTEPQPQNQQNPQA